MSAIDVGLGHAEVQVHESDISVKLTSSATFAPSEEDDIDYLHRMLKASIFERNTEALWIRRGHGFKLILSLDLNPLSNAADRAQVISVLTERIQASKVVSKSFRNHVSRLTHNIALGAITPATVVSILLGSRKHPNLLYHGPPSIRSFCD